MTDTEAQTLLCHARFVRTLAQHLLPNEAEDVEQETWLAAVRSGPRHSGALRAWLGTVTRNAARKLLRRREAVTRRETAGARSEAVPSTAELAAKEQMLRRVVEAVLALDEPYRSTILLRFYEDLAPREIARRQRVSVETVRSRVRRALALLRGRLDRDWGSRRAWCLVLMPWAGPTHAVAAATAVAGGILVNKKLVLVALLLALLLAGGLVLRNQWDTDLPHDRTTASRAERPQQATPTEGAPTPRPQTGCFGQVLDPEGRPVVGAIVRRERLWRQNRPGRIDAVDARPVSVTTDGEGHFEVGVTSGFHSASLVVEAAGYPHARTLAPVGKETIVRLERGGTLTVAVQTQAGEPVPDAEVGLLDGSRPQPARLSWDYLNLLLIAPGELSHVLPGEYQALVRAPGFAPALTAKLAVDAGTTVEHTVTLNRGIVMDVLVLGDGAPLAGAEVELRAGAGSGGVARTDARGRCTIAGLLPARVLDPVNRSVYWQVRADGFAIVRGHRGLPGRPGRDEFTLELEQGGRLTVRVRGEEPLAGAKVVLHWRRYSLIRRELEVRTGADGTARFPELPVREFEITVSHADYAGRRLTARVPSDIEVTLAQRGVALRGSVRTPEGAPARGRIGLLPEGAPPDTFDRICRGKLDAAGNFTLEDLPPGPGSLHVMADGFAHQTFPAHVRPDGASIDVRLREAGALRGVVVTEAGRPVPALRLRFYRMLEVRPRTHVMTVVARAMTDEQGAFVVRGTDGKPFQLMLPGYRWRVDGTRSRQFKGSDVRIVVRSAGRLFFTVVARVAGRPGLYDGPLQCVSGDFSLAPLLKEGPGRYVFSLAEVPGTYDLRFKAPGYRPCLASGVRLGEKDNQLEIELDPGAVLRVRVADIEGRPVRDRTLTVRGHGAKRTDSKGTIVLGGNEPGTLDLHLSDPDNHLLFARARGVAVPGRIDVVLQRWATIYILHERKWSDVKSAVTWRAYDSSGELIDEHTSELHRNPKFAEIPCFGGLSVPSDGRYRVVASIDGEELEGEVETRVGRTARLELR